MADAFKGLFEGLLQVIQDSKEKPYSELVILATVVIVLIKAGKENVPNFQQISESTEPFDEFILTPKITGSEITVNTQKFNTVTDFFELAQLFYQTMFGVKTDDTDVSDKIKEINKAFNNRNNPIRTQIYLGHLKSSNLPGILSSDIKKKIDARCKTVKYLEQVEMQEFKEIRDLKKSITKIGMEEQLCIILVDAELYNEEILEAVPFQYFYLVIYGKEALKKFCYPSSTETSTATSTEFQSKLKRLQELNEKLLDVYILDENITTVGSLAVSQPPVTSPTVGSSTVGSSTVGSSTVGSSTVGSSTVGSLPVGLSKEVLHYFPNAYSKYTIMFNANDQRIMSQDDNVKEYIILELMHLFLTDNGGVKKAKEDAEKALVANEKAVQALVAKAVQADALSTMFVEDIMDDYFATKIMIEKYFEASKKSAVDDFVVELNFTEKFIKFGKANFIDTFTKNIKTIEWTNRNLNAMLFRLLDTVPGVNTIKYFNYIDFLMTLFGSIPKNTTIRSKLENTATIITEFVNNIVFGESALIILNTLLDMYVTSNLYEDTLTEKYSTSDTTGQAFVQGSNSSTVGAENKIVEIVKNFIEGKSICESSTTGGDTCETILETKDINYKLILGIVLEPVTAYDLSDNLINFIKHIHDNIGDNTIFDSSYQRQSYTDNNGNVYNGFIRIGSNSGNGRYWLGKKHGNGKFTYKNGTVYDGVWDEDIFETGTVTFTNGFKFEGKFENYSFANSTKVTIDNEVWSVTSAGTHVTGDASKPFIIELQKDSEGKTLYFNGYDTLTDEETV